MNGCILSIILFALVNGGAIMVACHLPSAAFVVSAIMNIRLVWSMLISYANSN